MILIFLYYLVAGTYCHIYRDMPIWEYMVWLFIYLFFYEGILQTLIVYGLDELDPSTSYVLSRPFVP